MKKNIIDALIKNYSKESRLEYLRRITSLSVLVAMLTTSSASVVLAKDTNGVTDKNKTKKVENVKNNTSTEEKKNERVEHASTLEEAMADEAKEVKSEVTVQKSQPSIASLAATTTKYDFNYLNTLSYNQLTDLLKTIQWNDINGLFEYSAGSATFFGDKNRVQAVMNALEESGRTYTTTDIKGITTLVEVLRAAFYLGFYNDDLSYLKDQTFKDRCIPAMLAIEKNPNFKLGTPVQDEVVTSLGKLIGNAYCNHEVVNGCAPIMKQFIQGMDVYAGNYVKGTAVHTLMKEIEFAFSNASYNKKPEEMSWYGKINPFIDELKKLTLYGRVTNDNEWVINNGIFYLSKIGTYANRDNEIKRALTDAMNMYEKYGDQYFKALDRLMLDYNGVDADGNKIDEDKIIKDATKHYLPKTYTFDNGHLIIQAGDKVSEQKIKKLYWASKEVKSQFHRVIGNDKALEQGHVDDVLTMKIFNSPKEYKINTNLTGISTDNGGIYIEPQGTFYTYERTEQESIYSLEELFRHEFTHYLQCRYLVKGMWGNGPFYENEELTWYDEGTAEFFAGSTRTSGILPRKSVTSYIPADASRRYSLKDTVNATYNNGGDVYTYGFAMANYMYAKDMPTFAKINKAILNNDITNYKKYISELAKDQNKNTQYQSYMQGLVDNYHNLTVPLVSEDYLLDHGYKKASEVYSDITKAASLKNVKVEKENSQFFDTFTLSGTYTGDVSKGEHEDWKAMSKKIDDSLKALSKNSWSGYRTLTAYFTDYKVTSDNKVQYNVVFHGVLTDKNNTVDENKSPIVKITAQNTAEVGNKIKFSSNGTMDEDGQIASYSWNFGDGKTSNEENPVHVFEKEGEYNITLTVKDDKGASSTEKISVKVTKADSTNPEEDVIREKEDNGSIENANLIPINKTVLGGFDYYDSNDYYTFELDTPGKINIEVNKLNDFGANWILYREGDSSNYISYAKIQGNKLVNDVNLYEGKYHLCVYKTSGTGNYELKISK